MPAPSPPSAGSAPEPADRGGSAAGWLDLLRSGRAVFTVLLNLAVILHGVNIFVLTTIMPSVVDDIGGAAYYTWPATFYLIGTIVGAAGGAPVRAAFGRRRGYVSAGLIFVAGSALGAAAPSMALLLAGQLLQGFGGGLMLSQSMALVREIYGEALRGRVLALINTAWVAAALVGPAAAGFFAEIDWWRGALWTLIPVALLVCALGGRYVPVSERRAAGPGLPVRRLALLAAGVLCVAAAGQAGSAAAGAALVAGAMVLVAVTLRFDARAENPMFPKRALSLSTAVGAAYWIFIALAFTQTAPSIFLPLLLGALHGVPDLWIGYFNMLMSFAWSASSIAVAHLAGRSARRFAMLSGFALSIFGLGGIAVGVDGAGLVWHGAMAVVVGLGIGLANVIAITWIMSISAPGEESLTASAVPALRSLGLAFGAASVGLIANAGGLGATAGPAEVSTALVWVFGLSAIAPAAGLLLVWRTFSLVGRRAG